MVGAVGSLECVAAEGLISELHDLICTGFSRVLP
jgi:hypothetical protein